MTLIMNGPKATGAFVVMLTMALLAGRAPVIAQGDESVDPLVGVWESVSPSQIDCQTGQPQPGAPVIRAVYAIQQGGTMSEQNTDPVEGPYRSAGFGIWKRTSARNYAAGYQHYGFVDPNLMPTTQLGAVVKVKTTIRLSRDAMTFVERGTFAVFFPDPLTSELGEPLFSGCFAATAHRMTL